MASISLTDGGQQDAPAEAAAADVLHQALLLVAFPTHLIWDPQSLELKRDFEVVRRVFQVGFARVNETLYFPCV